MSSGLRIAPMTLDDLRVAIDWAAGEGWNPGLDDADAFYDVDPGGFLMGWVDGERATAISVVAHSDTYGFLGFYLCRPEFRGQGHGFATWQAGLARLEGRVVGLDGVPDQEGNYRKSGFDFAFRSHRYEGEIDAAAHPDIEPASDDDLPELLALDAATTGVARSQYMGRWFRGTATRQTLVYRQNQRIAAMGTIRHCRLGHKIGPLVAPDPDTAEAMVRSLAASAGARRIAIDIPEICEAGVELQRRLELESAFACARMYKGTAPEMVSGRMVGIATFELG